MMQNIDNLVSRLVHELDHRYYGKYRGRVVDNDDPEQRGRLKLVVPELLGEEVTGWALPCVPYGGAANQGMFFIPEVESTVWVEFEGGDLEFPIWVGAYWPNPGGDSEVPTPVDPDGAELDIQSPPTRKIIKTLKGHTIQFEDADGEEMIIIQEATNGHIITLNSDGIVIQDATGNRIEMNDSAFNILAAVPFTIDASGQPIVLIGDTIDLNKG